MSPSLPVIILGGGGHGYVLMQYLIAQNRTILAIADPNPVPLIKNQSNISIIQDEEIVKYPSSTIELINGIGSISSLRNREKIFNNFKKLGYRFSGVIHPSAVISKDVQLGEGVQIMAGAIIQPGVKIGDNCIINTRSSVDHFCQIGTHVHISPGVVLSGHVKVGNCVHIGTGACIIQEISILDNSIIGAGAAVIQNVPVGVKAVGVPARII